MKFENGIELRQKIENGISIVAENVASTLGPRGRTVILQGNKKNPIATKDGVTVAKFIGLDDPFENIGAQLVKQAAEKTNQEAGDGTTTTTILTHSMYKSAQKYLAAGAPPIELKRGMEKAVESLVACIYEKSRQISSLEDIKNIATISANGDRVIGGIVSKAVDMAGKDGSITIEDSRSLETSLELIEGFRVDSGYLASVFINDERKAMALYDDPIFIVTDEKVSNVQTLLPALEIAAREGRPFIIFAEDISGQALAALCMNAIRGNMKVCGIKAPRYGQERRDVLRDIALTTGATFLSKEAGKKLEEATLEDFGRASKIEVGKNMTTILGGNVNPDKLTDRIEMLKSMIKDEDNLKECEKLQNRITRLSSGAAVIKVGAATEVEMIEKRHRIEDSLEAVKSAQSEGVLPGGGVFLIQNLNILSEESFLDKLDNDYQRLGVKIVQEAVKEPLKRMAENAGQSPDIIINEIQDLSNGEGWDFDSEKVVNMEEIGVLDPARVTRCAIENSLSVVGTLITSNYAIVENSN